MGNGRTADLQGKVEYVLTKPDKFSGNSIKKTIRQCLIEDSASRVILLVQDVPIGCNYIIERIVKLASDRFEKKQCDQIQRAVDQWLRASTRRDDNMKFAYECGLADGASDAIKQQNAHIFHARMAREYKLGYDALPKRHSHSCTVDMHIIQGVEDDGYDTIEYQRMEILTLSNKVKHLETQLAKKTNQLELLRRGMTGKRSRRAYLASVGKRKRVR